MDLFGWFMVLLVLAVIIASFLAAIVGLGFSLLIAGAIALPIITISKGVKWYSRKPEAISSSEYFWSSARKNWIISAILISIGALLLTFPAISLFVHGSMQLDTVVWGKVLFPGLPVLYLLTIPVPFYFIFDLLRGKEEWGGPFWEIIATMVGTIAFWGLSWLIASLLWGVGLPLLGQLIEIGKYLSS